MVAKRPVRQLRSAFLLLRASRRLRRGLPASFPPRFALRPLRKEQNRDPVQGRRRTSAYPESYRRVASGKIGTVPDSHFCPSTEPRAPARGFHLKRGPGLYKRNLVPVPIFPSSTTFCFSVDRRLRQCRFRANCGWWLLACASWFLNPALQCCS